MRDTAGSRILKSLSINMGGNHWYYLDIAESIAQKSKNPSTKVGALIVTINGEAVSWGYNGFPKSMPDKLEWLENRVEKYERVIHAEHNAILFAKQSLEDCTLYTYPFMPCHKCALIILQVGIRKVVAPAYIPERWQEAMVRSRGYMEDNGVFLELVDYE